MELTNDQLSSFDDNAAFQQQQQQVVLMKIITTTQKTIKSVERQFQYQAKQSRLIIGSTTDVLGNDTFVNEMSDTFRLVFQGIVRETRERFDKLHSESAAVDKSFAKIINQLSKRI